MNHTTNDNYTESCEGNDIIMPTVDNSNVHENGGNRSCGEINNVSMVNSDHVNLLEKETTASNDRVKKENLKTVPIIKLDSLHPNDDISSLKFYQSLLRKVIEMNFGDELDSGKFVLSKETFKTIISKLENKENEKRFEEVEIILYKSISYALRKNDEEFDRLEFMESIEEYFLNLIRVRMSFTVRKTLFSLIFLITSHPNVRDSFIIKTQKLLDIIGYNTYMDYFVPFMIIAYEETIPDDENSEFRIMVKMLYDRLCSNFNYNVLPLDNSIFSIEGAVIHLLHVIQEKGVERAMNNTIIYDIVKDLTSKLGTVFYDNNDEQLSTISFTWHTKRTLFSVALVINQIGSYVLRHGTYIPMFVQEIKVWKKIMEFLADSEDPNGNEPINKRLSTIFGPMGDYTKKYEDLLNLSLTKMERDSNE
ncbi:Hypothetical protein SRAE_X000011400 [Strongyloides ratti]|uniref:Uncharacterized protein n=1 Tax=Strongyloides ratti TaxID=34506 RepID=A0A090N0J2_STRRB|nr:Hypothetical protein SRAE_X000011400 [Strongyloides ratti]CEF70783.1 Hypothetical protein SRAE_X000011400 [Strongyloides ratti]